MITRKEVRVKKTQILSHDNENELSFNIKGNIKIQDDERNMYRSDRLARWRRVQGVS